MSLPYIETILAEIKTGNQELEHLVGEHLHWGLWKSSDPSINFETIHNAGDEMVRYVAQQGKISDNQKILDVGSGFGGTLRLLNRIFRNCELVGLNIDERQTKRARQLSVEENENVLQWVTDDAHKLPFADDSFDRIVAIESVFHFTKPATFFREAKRVLRPGGVMVFTDFLIWVPGLPVVALSMLPKLNDLKKVYGACKLSTHFKHRVNTKLAGFSWLSSEDMSLRVLPSLQAMDNNASSFGALGPKLVRLNRSLRWLTRLGLHRYEIICLRA